MLLEGLDKIIDDRFYVEDSDHRIIWNESCQHDKSRARAAVPALLACAPAHVQICMHVRLHMCLDMLPSIWHMSICSGV